MEINSLELFWRKAHTLSFDERLSLLQQASNVVNTAYLPGFTTSIVRATAKLIVAAPSALSDLSHPFSTLVETISTEHKTEWVSNVQVKIILPVTHLLTDDALISALLPLGGTAAAAALAAAPARARPVLAAAALRDSAFNVNMLPLIAEFSVPFPPFLTEFLAKRCSDAGSVLTGQILAAALESREILQKICNKDKIICQLSETDSVIHLCEVATASLPAPAPILPVVLAAALARPAAAAAVIRTLVSKGFFDGLTSEAAERAAAAASLAPAALASGHYALLAAVAGAAPRAVTPLVPSLLACPPAYPALAAWAGRTPPAAALATIGRVGGWAERLGELEDAGVFRLRRENDVAPMQLRGALGEAVNTEEGRIVLCVGLSSLTISPEIVNAVANAVPDSPPTLHHLLLRLIVGRAWRPLLHPHERPAWLTPVARKDLSAVLDASASTPWTRHTLLLAVLGAVELWPTKPKTAAKVAADVVARGVEGLFWHEGAAPALLTSCSERFLRALTHELREMLAGAVSEHTSVEHVALAYKVLCETRDALPPLSTVSPATTLATTTPSRVPLESYSELIEQACKCPVQELSTGALFEHTSFAVQAQAPGWPAATAAVAAACHARHPTPDLVYSLAAVLAPHTPTLPTLPFAPLQEAVALTAAVLGAAPAPAPAALAAAAAAHAAAPTPFTPRALDCLSRLLARAGADPGLDTSAWQALDRAGCSLAVLRRLMTVYLTDASAEQLVATVAGAGAGAGVVAAAVAAAAAAAPAPAAALALSEISSDRPHMIINALRELPAQPLAAAAAAAAAATALAAAANAAADTCEWCENTVEVGEAVAALVTARSESLAGHLGAVAAAAVAVAGAATKLSVEKSEAVSLVAARVLSSIFSGSVGRSLNYVIPGLLIKLVTAEFSANMSPSKADAHETCIANLVHDAPPEITDRAAALASLSTQDGLRAVLGRVRARSASTALDGAV